MNQRLLQLVGEYVSDEWHDYLYYTQVAENVKTAEQQRMLREFAHDEYQHAVLLAQYYAQMTGMYPFITPYQPKPVPQDLEKVFLGRVKAESGDMKKYKELYLMAQDPQLRDIVFNAITDETQHSIRLLYLAEKAD